MGEVTQRIQDEASNAEAILHEVTEELITLFEAMDNEVLKERCSDLRDVSARIGSYLGGRREGSN